MEKFNIGDLIEFIANFFKQLLVKLDELRNWFVDAENTPFLTTTTGE